MLSFKQLLDDQKGTHQKQAQQNICLFTRLKRNIINKSMSQSRTHNNSLYQKSLDQIMKQYELQFQILKLEKANFVVSRHQLTGLPVSYIMKQIMEGLSQQIELIINKKSDPLKDTKATNHLESTFGNTLQEHSFGRQYCNSAGGKENLTPKIIQFTLGNKENSSQKSNIYQNNGQEVSQFFINGKGLISKNIREKVMGQRKLK